MRVLNSYVINYRQHTELCLSTWKEYVCCLFIYADNEPKSALARDLGDCRDNKGKLAKRVFTCLQEIPMELPVKKMDTNGTQNTYLKIV